MKILSLEAAKHLTQEYHSMWLVAHREAEKIWWQTVRTKVPELFLAAPPATRAENLHFLIVREVQKNAEAKFINVLGFPVQIVSNEVGFAIVRFKQLDRELRTRNHPSGQQDALDEHAYTPEVMEQLQLEGIPEPPTVLTCGFRLAADELSISDMQVVCAWKRDPVYTYDIESGQDAVILNLPGTGELPETQVRPRKQETAEDADGDPE